MYPWLIQWYAYTGTAGGGLWIWVTNGLVFLVLLRPERAKVYAYRIAIILIVPTLISVLIYASYKDRGAEEAEIVVLQPNIDPYSEKFANSENFIPFPEQIRRFIELSESKITDNTDFLVWPETAIDKWIQETNISRDGDIQRILQFKSRYPDIAMVTGLTSYTVYGKEKKTQTARYNETIGYYDSFNTALWVDQNATQELYHKSKLVPGVEIMPYPFLFNFLIELVFDLGGTTGGYGRQDERTVFETPGGTGVAPSICYESIYGDFMSSYVRGGAGVIFIITNDGWWGDTPGYRQHMQYATMRAIETRRGIARSANTGISGFINQRGDIIEATDYWVQDVRRNTLKINKEITFYAAYGDYISRTTSWLSIFLILATIVKLRKKR
jgi:apolipoprotein N-acyltransferase